MNSKSVFARNLNFFMAANGKNRKDVANALKVSYYTVSDWVNGKKYPRMDKVDKLADYFGVTKAALIEERDTGEMELANETVVNMLFRMDSDPEYASFMEDVYPLDSNQIKALREILRSLHIFAK